MARPRKAPVATDERTPAEYASALVQAVELFRERHPEEWEAMKLCPLQHGLQEMAKRLR